MKEYREIYNELNDSVPSGFLSHTHPATTDDMLRDLGLDVRGIDSINSTQAAMIVYLTSKINELEKKLTERS